MKTITISNPLKKTLFIILAAATVCIVNSCAQKISFLNSAAVPAARGDVKLTTDKNNNYVIAIQLENLAEVERLQPPKRTYVVWMESASVTTKNIGKISSGSGRFSSKLKASFETVSAVKPTKIFITAEDDADTQYPGSQIILSTNNF